jgi:hypothetical protein
LLLYVATAAFLALIVLRRTPRSGSFVFSNTGVGSLKWLLWLLAYALGFLWALELIKPTGLPLNAIVVIWMFAGLSCQDST